MIDLIKPVVETFTYRFRGGYRATMRITVKNGTPSHFDVEWTPRLPMKKKLRRIFGEYQKWRNNIFAALSKKYNPGRWMVLDVGGNLPIQITGLDENGQTVDFAAP